MSYNLEILSQALEPTTAKIYLILAENGEMNVPQIVEKSALSRTVIYEILAELLAKDFVDYRKEGRNAYYKIKHPSKILDLAEDKKREATQFSGALSQVVQNLSGTYNLYENKPGVRFFEGEEGIREALYDTLSSKTPIYAYLDYHYLLTIEDINKEYVKKRREMKISKKILVPNTPENIEAALPGAGEFTEIRFLPAEVASFPTTMQIYDEKIAYLTFKKNQIISVIIENDAISKMHKTMFEYQWSISKPFEDLVQTHNNEHVNLLDQ